MVMQQTKPFFYIRRYKKVLYASLAIEIVSFVVTLTDSIVAANMIDMDALIAIGLISPFQFAAMFLASVINSGTLLNYTRAIGDFDRRRACEVFSQGCILALGLGVLFACFMLAIKGVFLRSAVIPDKTRDYLETYYDVIIWYFLFFPLYTVLDNTVMNDGGERLSSSLNMVQIISNVLLSIFLSRSFGVKGIAVASVVCQFVAMGMACTWFFRKKSSARFVLSFRWKSFLLLRDGIGRSVAYAMTAVMVWNLNPYVNNVFGPYAMTEFIIVRKTMELSLIFMGLALALQPFIGMLRGEGNTKAEKQLMREVCLIMLVMGLVFSLGMFIFAPQFAAAFGFQSEFLWNSAVPCVRIVVSTLFVRAFLMLFFVYYYLTDRRGMMYLITIMCDFVTPIILGILGGTIADDQVGIWIGIAVSPVVTLLVSACVARFVYGREQFPLLIPQRNDEKIFIYDFPLTVENCMDMVETAGSELKKTGYPLKTVRQVELVLEETLMLIREKNRNEKKKLLAECTIILEDEGIRLILRDTGVVFDVTDSEADIHSFRQYIVTQIMTIPKSRLYITSSGYNRSEYFFAEKETGRQGLEQTASE